jgi:tetratricopeptide (TPR) repeat protein
VRKLRGGASVERIAAAGVCVIVLAALGARTYARNADWQDERTLWKSALVASPNSFKVYKGSATAVWANGNGTGEPEVDAAIALAERGLTILDSPPLPIAREDNALFLDLGVYYRFKGEYLAKRGMLEEAHRFFQKSVAVLLRAREVDRWVNDASRQALMNRGRAAAEIPDSGNFNIYVQLGAAYLDLNDWNSCEEAGRQAMRLQPLNIDGYRLVAIARLNAGNAYDAAMFYIQIVTLQPGNTSAWNELAFCLERLGLKPVPIVYAGGSPVLDDRQPVARSLINDAAVALVRHLRDVKQVEAARTYQQDFVNRLRVPAPLFQKSAGR